MGDDQNVGIHGCLNSPPPLPALPPSNFFVRVKMQPRYKTICAGAPPKGGVDDDDCYWIVELKWQRRTEPRRAPPHVMIGTVVPSVVITLLKWLLFDGGEGFPIEKRVAAESKSSAGLEEATRSDLVSCN